MRVQTGNNVGIGGFIISGNVPKRVIVRAIGPSLTHFGVPNVLADPVLFRREFASLIESAVSDATPNAITVRVTRTGKAAGIVVVNERGSERSDEVIGSMTLPLAPGASSAADA